MGEYNLKIPTVPHIFMAHELNIVVQQPDGTEKVTLENSPVIMAHGAVDNEGVWKFLDGQEVYPVVNAFNKFALSNKLPPIEVIVACHPPNPADNSEVKIYNLFGNWEDGTQ